MIKSKKMRWVGYITFMGELKISYKILVRKAEERRPIRRPGHRWKNNLKVTWCGVVN
jgi:hypothetical protein